MKLPFRTTSTPLTGKEARRVLRAVETGQAVTNERSREFVARVLEVSFGLAGGLKERREDGNVSPMQICVEVTPCPDTGGYSARWDDPLGGGISTQGESIADLEEMVRDAVDGYFADRDRPASVRLHFMQDPLLHLA